MRKPNLEAEESLKPDGSSAPRTRVPKKRRLVFAFIASGLSLLIGLGVLELGLRICHISFPSYYMPDQHVGSRLRPHTTGWFRNEGHAWVSINALGMRDKPREINRPDNIYRIAVLGDSFIEALQVPLAESFTQQLEQRLNAVKYAQGKEIEVLNFGVSGYGTAQELQLLRHSVWKFQPDEVIVAIFPENDVRNNSPELEPDKCRPFFSLLNDELKLDNSFQQSHQYTVANSSYEQTKAAIVNRSATLQFLKELKSRMHADQNNAAQSQDLKQTLLTNIKNAVYVYKPPQTEAASTAWIVTEKLLDTMKSECEAKAAKFSVMIVSNPLEVLPDTELQREIASELNIEDVHYAANRLSAWAESNAIPCCTIATEYNRLNSTEPVALHGFHNTLLGQGHWSAHGHAFAAEHVAEMLTTYHRGSEPQR